MPVRTFIVVLALAIPLAAAAPAAAAPKTTPCPTFRVLHNNPMAGYNAGTYDMQVWGNTTCKQAVAIFQQYLSNPRSLPKGWKPDTKQSAFNMGNSTGFSLSLVRRPKTPNPNGAVANCPTFRVVRSDPQAGFNAGTYELQVWGTTTCSQAASVFKAYLSNPKSGLPKGWVRVTTPPSFRNGTSGFTVFQP
jgi:hypothetical protein